MTNEIYLLNDPVEWILPKSLVKAQSKDNVPWSLDD